MAKYRGVQKLRQSQNIFEIKKKKLTHSKNIQITIVFFKLMLSSLSNIKKLLHPNKIIGAMN